VLTGLPKAKRRGRGPFEVISNVSKPYLSTPVIFAEVISVPWEQGLAVEQQGVRVMSAADGARGSGSAARQSAWLIHDIRP
jgi:hypothetical protein